MIDGRAHGPLGATTVCQLHMRTFRDGDTITIEPWRARAFPVLKDLVVDRSAFDRVIAAGGYTSASVGGAPDANAILVPKDTAEASMDAAACIACGACVAQCKNASAALFTSAKLPTWPSSPRGRRSGPGGPWRMVRQMDAEGFGSCSWEGQCEAVCPKQIKVLNISRMVREFNRAALTGESG